MKVKFRSLQWEKGGRYVEQGIKDNQTPQYAIYGGSGSFMCEKHPTLVLSAEAEDGTDFSWNIIHQVKAANQWEKLSEKRVDNLESILRTKNVFEVDNSGLIKDLATLVKVKE